MCVGNTETGELRTDGGEDTEDQKTVQMKEDVNATDAPIIPQYPDRMDIPGVDVLGACKVQNSDDHGGVWNLSLDAGFPATRMTVAEVDDRLEPGVYALVRVEDADD